MSDKNDDKKVPLSLSVPQDISEALLLKAKEEDRSKASIALRIIRNALLEDGRL